MVGEEGHNVLDSAEIARDVERLKAGDAAMWALVRERSVRMEMERFRHSRIVRLRHVTEDELLSMLFEEMVGRGKLSLYRGEGDLYGWLGKYVVGYIHKFNSASRREIPMGLMPAGLVGNRGDAPLCRDRRRFAERCFGELWRENPLCAYVHYLKLAEGLSSCEIRDMFCLSSEANVDQMGSRFRREFRERVARDA